MYLPPSLLLLFADAASQAAHASSDGCSSWGGAIFLGIVISATILFPLFVRPRWFASQTRVDLSFHPRSGSASSPPADEQASPDAAPSGSDGPSAPNAP